MIGGLECWKPCFQHFNVTIKVGVLPHETFMTEKFKKCVETAEILINYAEEIIDIATELQYILVEREGIKQDSEGYSSQKMPELRTSGSNEERTQEAKREVDTSLEVQKVYVPIFRISKNNGSAGKSVEA